MNKRDEAADMLLQQRWQKAMHVKGVELTRCAVKRRRSSAGAIPARQLVAPVGSNRSGGEGNEAVGAFDVEGRFGRLSEYAGRNVSERRAGLENHNAGADPTV